MTIRVDLRPVLPYFLGHMTQDVVRQRGAAPDGKGGLSKVSARRGTGTRRSGQAAIKRILESTHAVLEQSGHRQLSMRSVAEHAGIRLSNLQYYFPTLDDLLRALLEDIADRYARAYERCVSSARGAVARFNAVLAFNLSDIHRRRTRSYFIQLWALLDGLDASSNRRLAQLYEMDIAQLGERIAELDPSAAPMVVRRRATLLAATIEGLMIVQGAHSADPAEKQYLMQQAQRLGLSIALGRHDQCNAGSAVPEEE